LVPSAARTAWTSERIMVVSFRVKRGGSKHGGICQSFADGHESRQREYQFWPRKPDSAWDLVFGPRGCDAKMQIENTIASGGRRG
jgi:hypothetical protein